MHETSLNRSIKDYLTGQDVEETTYEGMRQGLAKLLIEEKGYPREAVRSRLLISFEINGGQFTRTMDFGVFFGNQAALLIIFCPGEVSTFAREALAGARLFDPPFPLVCVTDTTKAQLLCVEDGKILAEGYQAIPAWEELSALVEKHPPAELSPERRAKEQRLFYTYSAFMSCCSTGCEVKGQKT